MSVTRAQQSANGNGLNQIAFGDKPTDPVVNRNIHETNENELQTPKNVKLSRVFTQ